MVRSHRKSELAVGRRVLVWPHRVPLPVELVVRVHREPVVEVGHHGLAKRLNLFDSRAFHGARVFGEAREAKEDLAYGPSDDGSLDFVRGAANLGALWHAGSLTHLLRLASGGG